MKKFVEKLASAEDKIAVCEKTAGLWCRKFSDLNSACSKVLVPIKIFQFLGTFRRQSKRPNCGYIGITDIQDGLFFVLTRARTFRKS